MQVNEDSVGGPDAATVLNQVQLVQRRVAKQGPRDWVVWAAWGLWVLVFIPPFDIANGNIWGPIVVLSSLGGTAVTTRYYTTRYQRVHPLLPSRWRIWFVWSVWYIAWIAFAAILADRLEFAWTIAAVAAALPLLVYAAVVRGRSQAR